jgi:hypothetical protein
MTPAGPREDREAELWLTGRSCDGCALERPTPKAIISARTGKECIAAVHVQPSGYRVKQVAETGFPRYRFYDAARGTAIGILHMMRLRMGPEARGVAGLLAVVAAITALARTSSYLAPISRDTGQMLYGGQIVLNGGTPYHDVAVNKGPLTYLLFAVLRLLVGQSEVAVRLTLLAFAVAAGVGLAMYLHRAADPWIAKVGGIIFALLSALHAFQGDDPNLEQYAIAPMALALWLASGDSLIRAAASGAMTAVVAALSPSLALPLAPVVLLTLWWRCVDARRRCFAAMVSGGGVAAAVGLWLLSAGALPDLFKQVPGTTGGEPRSDLLSFSHLVGVPARPLWIAGLAGTLIASRRSHLRIPALGALIWILLSWARANVGDALIDDPVFPHHYYPAVLGLSAGLALGLGAVRSSGRRLQTAFATVLIVLLTGQYVLRPERAALLRPAARRGVSAYPWHYAATLAAYVDSHTQPKERIYVNGSQPEIYWLADRLSPTRFFDIYPIRAHPAYERERIDTLYRHPPAAIVLMHRDPLDPVLAGLIRKLDYRLAYSATVGRIWLEPSRHRSSSEPPKPATFD